MEVLRVEIERKKAVLAKIREQMGDLSIYSKESLAFLNLAELSAEGAAAALREMRTKDAIYLYGRCCENVGSLLERARKEKDNAPVAPVIPLNP